MDCDDDALVNGANLAVLGSELIQFGSVKPLGAGRFELSNLLRGRAGTEWAMDGHVAGEAFALIERDALRAVPMPSWATGAEVSASARNISGTTSTSAPLQLSGESVRPFPPVALRVERDGDGSLRTSWTRRTRAPAGWTDGIDMPLGERVELYRVTLIGSLGSVEAEAGQTELQFPAAQVAAVGLGPASIQVRQVGDAALSRAAEISFTI